MEEIAKVFGLNLKLLIIQMINFGILLVVLWYFLYKPVLAIIDTRRDKIAEGVKDVHLAKDRLIEIEDERLEVLKKATDGADVILSVAKERATEQSADLIKTATKRAETLVHNSEMRSQEMKEQAMRESNTEITKVAILAASKILQEKNN